MKIGFLISLFQAYVICKLSINSPQQLKSYFSENRTIPFSIANFGDIPWGHKFIGNLSIADPLNACTPLNMSTTRFVLIKRGGCSFVTKVRNAESAGYSLAIIEDNRQEFSENLTMADDGLGYTVKIPSIFIEQKHGEILQRYLEKNLSEFEDYTQPLQLSIQFDVNQQSIVNVVFALSLKNNKETFKMLRDFRPYYEKLIGSPITYDFQYQIFSMPTYNNMTTENENCLGSGRYCASDPDGFHIGTGAHIVGEALREICIFKHFPQVWFDYMDQFYLNCTLVQAYDGCSNKIRRQLKIDNAKFEECILESYYDPLTNQSITSKQLNVTSLPNSLLDHQLDLVATTGVRGYPGAVINGQAYKGRISAKDIFGEICNGYKNPPLSCQGEVDVIISPASSDHSLLFTILIIIGILILFFMIMYVVYARVIRRDINSRPGPEVAEMIQSYIQFYEAKDKKKAEAV